MHMVTKHMQINAQGAAFPTGFCGAMVGRPQTLYRGQGHAPPEEKSKGQMR